MFCLYCGNRLPENALFCNQCGRRQNSAANPQNPAMANTSTAANQENGGTKPFFQQAYPQQNSSPTPFESSTQITGYPMEQTTGISQGFRVERNAGFITAVIGGIVGIVSFFTMPYLSYGYFTATGQQLASLGYQYASQYNSSYNSYSSNSSQYNSLLLLWLLPVIAGIITLIGGIQLFRRNETGKKASAGWLIALAIIAMLGLIGAYIYITNQIQSATSSSVSINSVIGSGIWIYMIAMVAVIAGGIIQIRSSQ